MIHRKVKWLLLVVFVDRIKDKICENFQIASILSSLVIFPKYFSSIATVAQICCVSLYKYTLSIHGYWDTPGNAFRTNHSKSWIFHIKKSIKIKSNLIDFLTLPVFVSFYLPYPSLWSFVFKQNHTAIGGVQWKFKVMFQKKYIHRIYCISLNQKILLQDIIVSRWWQTNREKSSIQSPESNITKLYYPNQSNTFQYFRIQNEKLKIFENF